MLVAITSSHLEVKWGSSVDALTTNNDLCFGFQYQCSLLGAFLVDTPVTGVKTCFWKGAFIGDNASWIYAYLQMLVWGILRKATIPTEIVYYVKRMWLLLLHFCTSPVLWVWGLVQRPGMHPPRFMAIHTAEGIFMEGVLCNSKQFNRNVIRQGKVQSLGPFRVQIMAQIKGLELCSL